jgi:predicted nucleotidyltransferase component of viral defense system
MKQPLKPIRTRLNKLREKTNIELSVYERDYLISFVLLAISQVQPLAETLVFKGGTALRKCYFADYRFSEDLDFSALDHFVVDELDAALNQMCAVAASTMQQYEPFEIAWSRVPERAPHPKGQQAISIRGKFPWHTHESTWSRIKLEISVDEKILRPPVRRQILHVYEEPVEGQLLTYSLEEIVAEKMRGLLQWAKKLDEKPFAKARARDYYDLWKILGSYREGLDMSGFAGFLNQKCAIKDVRFDNVESFFDPRVVAQAKQSWETNLSHMALDLPTFDAVCAYLRVEMLNLIQ